MLWRRLHGPTKTFTPRIAATQEEAIEESVVVPDAWWTVNYCRLPRLPVVLLVPHVGTSCRTAHIRFWEPIRVRPRLAFLARLKLKSAGGAGQGGDTGHEITESLPLDQHMFTHDPFRILCISRLDCRVDLLVLLQ